MGVTKYIEDYNRKRDLRIQKNIEYANSNPYPIDELNALKDGSALKVVFDENGETNNHQLEVKNLAMSQDPDLYNRLHKGSRGLHKLKQNQELLNIDPREELDTRYSAVVNGITSSNLNIDNLINSETFEQLYSEIMESANIKGLNVSTSIIQAAFKELNGNSESDDTINTLNPDDISENNIDEEGPLNDNIESFETVEIGGEADNEVIESTPEVEKELILANNELFTRDEIDEKRGFKDIQPVSPINSDVTAGDHDIDGNGIVTAAEYSSSVMSNIIENVKNEVSNINDQITEINNSDVRGSIDVYPDDIDIKNDSPSINESMASSSYGIGELDNLAATTPEDLALLRSTLGMTESVITNESNNIINESVDNNSQVIGDTSEVSTSVNSPQLSLEKEKEMLENETSEIEVSRGKVSIDKKIAPINTPAILETKTPSESESEQITVTEVKSESGGSASTSSTDMSSVTNNENNKSENNHAGYSITDMSGVEARLRHIENLLSGTLEVKIIE